MHLNIIIILYLYVCLYVLSYVCFLAGNDFQRLSDALATASNNSNGCFRINITDDNDSEGTEQFTVFFIMNFTVPTSVNITRITSDPNVTTIFIQDNDG